MNSELKPKIRFKGFTDDWEQRKLGEIMDITSVKRIHQSDWTESGIRFFRARDIVAEFKNETVEDKLYISKEKYDEYSMISGKVQVNDLLLTGVGTIGIPYLIKDNKPLYFKDGNIIWLKNNNKINGYFLFYSFIGRKIQSFINEKAGIGTVGTYTIQSGKETPITLTKKEEQSKISKLLFNIDSLITLHQRKCDKLVELKKSLLEKMFPQNNSVIPEIRFKGFTDDWEQRKLGDIGYTFTGLSGKTKDDFGHGQARFVTYMNVFSNPIATIEKTDWVEIDHKQNEVQYGDIFFTTSSETPEEVGMSSVWLENMTNIYLNSFCFGFRPTEKKDPYYMAYMLRAKDFRNKMILLAQGISRYNISKNSAMDIEIQLPKSKEQESIGKLFYKIDNLITLHQRKHDKLNKIKQSLLNDMFV